MCLPLGLWHRFTDGRAGNLFNDCIDVNSITEILTKMHESNFQGVCVRRQAQHTKRTLRGNELPPKSKKRPLDVPSAVGSSVSCACFFCR